MGGEVIGSHHHQHSGSSRAGVDPLAGRVQPTLSPGGRFSTCKPAPRTWLRILPLVFEELKSLDFVEWLNYYCFLFSQYFSTFLIKLVL